MAGIVGITAMHKKSEVARMLGKIAYRGKKEQKIIEGASTTLGAVWGESEERITPPSMRRGAVWDAEFPPLPDPGALPAHHEAFALACDLPQGFFLARDALGVRPLYYGKTGDGATCFASEVKALLEVTRDIHEFPNGCWMDKNTFPRPFYRIEVQPPLEEDYPTLAAALRLRLEQAVCRRIHAETLGCWLSGGLDSSVLAALVRPHVRQMHTFAGGLAGAPDLEYARRMADFLKAEHHEVIVTLNGLLNVLPDVIRHLESFDALLVRSSLLNYLVAEAASHFTGASFSGEGGDELFGGYDYLKDIPESGLAEELAEIAGRLHNTALQRVDRSAAAHGLAIHVPFLDLEVFELALRIPAGAKIKRNGAPVEKWILRQAMADALPEDVLWRVKAKFWQGSGVGELLAEHAGTKIKDDEFVRERNLRNGWSLNTKEELFYYRIFREHFGDLENLDWMGRTKGAPSV